MDSPRVAVIIEDDQDIRELIEVVLNQSGFEVHAVNRGAAGVEAVREFSPTIVTLDLGLPDIDGFEVARQIRLFSDSYIIMLTARAEELDTLMGLESGADDYLTKPFRPRELRARVSAMLRRPRRGHEPTSAADSRTAEVPSDGTVDAPALSVNAVAFGTTAMAESAVMTSNGGSASTGTLTRDAGNLLHNGLLLNGATRSAEVDGAELELTRTEFDLLHALMESGKMVRTKADLVRRLRDDDYDTGGYISDADERTIEVHMGNLRRKLGDDPKAPRWVKTIRGVGYRLAP
ncbi:response regulator transcription factor [Arthrobacter sp. H14-L1]|uniref:response regulator transcription factor n=1 Tax=Arthrobacter sp. H14-L1 TaxID=2996697 RepID=UPI00226FE394|nr:response regulator transcription factor [Arthrobacter sp. H14-L1]MCY0905690.1 response regulator transcription factor [Arthrobacter sp. H14-L1]